MANTHLLPLPDVKHGERMAISIVDERARTDPQSPWVSVPVDDQDISKGYKDITYSQFANAVNHAAHWLVQHMPSSQEPFQSFAYAGPKDLRYPILAMAAGKLGKVVCYPNTCFLLFIIAKRYLLLRLLGVDDSAFTNGNTRGATAYLREEEVHALCEAGDYGHRCR